MINLGFARFGYKTKYKAPSNRIVYSIIKNEKYYSRLNDLEFKQKKIFMFTKSYPINIYSGYLKSSKIYIYGLIR